MADYVGKEDAVVVRQLRAEGAIPIVKGNVPQLMLALSSHNEVYGLAKNPWDQGRASGGSSGGDGGLVGARCVPFSIGTDIGGSIRCPAVFNGIYGFKPSAMRISYKNCIAPLEDGSAP